MDNNKTVFFILGALQVILGLSMIFPIIVQIIYDELNGSFISSRLIAIIIGILFILSNLDQNKKINLQQAFFLTSLSCGCASISSSKLSEISFVSCFA